LIQYELLCGIASPGQAAGVKLFSSGPIGGALYQPFSFDPLTLTWTFHTVNNQPYPLAASTITWQLV